MDRIIYKCKKCGWRKSITAAYEDVKPRRCLGRKCKTFFTLNPELLEIIKPEKAQLPEKPTKPEPKVEPKWTKKKKKQKKRN